MSGVREHYEWDEVQRLLSEGDAPTPDDVSIALDGRRLDTAEAVIRFFEELRLEKEAGLGQRRRMTIRRSMSAESSKRSTGTTWSACSSADLPLGCTALRA